jgi:hypothetical protein
VSRISSASWWSTRHFALTQRICHGFRPDFDFQHLAAVRHGKPKYTAVQRRAVVAARPIDRGAGSDLLRELATDCREMLGERERGATGIGTPQHRDGKIGQLDLRSGSNNLGPIKAKRARSRDVHSRARCGNVRFSPLAFLCA